jgi:uncharacterized protein (DUF2236 family)
MHQERVVGLFYGQRALAIGAAHPVNYTATAIHSTGKRTPFARLARTARMLEAIILGNRSEADLALESVNAIHCTVRGELPCDAGRYEVGTRYSAFDPELLHWTLAVIADSAFCFFELFVRQLSDDEKEAAWQDYRRLGELFKLAKSDTPETETYFAFCDWWQRRLASGELYLTPDARKTGYSVAFEIPVPKYAVSPWEEHNAIMLGSFPTQVRDLYGLVYANKDQERFLAASEKMRARRRHCPRWLAHGRNGWFFQWVARTERSRIRRGQPTLQLALPGTNESGELSANGDAGTSGPGIRETATDSI